jgi:hypothetical protein
MRPISRPHAPGFVLLFALSLLALTGCSDSATSPSPNPPHFVEFAPVIVGVELPGSVRAGDTVEGEVTIALGGCDQALLPVVESVTPTHFRVRLRASTPVGDDVVCPAWAPIVPVPFEVVALNQGVLTIDIVGRETRRESVQVLPRG